MDIIWTRDRRLGISLMVQNPLNADYADQFNTSHVRHNTLTFSSAQALETVGRFKNLDRHADQGNPAIIQVRQHSHQRRLVGKDARELRNGTTSLFFNRHYLHALKPVGPIRRQSADNANAIGSWIYKKPRC